MSDAPDGYIKVEDGAFYQKVAGDTQKVVFAIMNELSIGLARAIRPDIEEPTGVDGGCILGGAIGGILRWCLIGGGDPNECRRIINEHIDTILPQIVMEQAEQKAGAVGSGRA